MKKNIFLLLILMVVAFAGVDAQQPGDLDLSFNGTGIVKTDIGSFSSESANSLAVQTDGKIVAVGSSRDEFYSSSIFAVIRYNADGSLDNSFGTEGIVTNDSLPGANAVTIQPNGKIIVLDYEFTIVRLNSNGSFDTSFGNNGIVNTEIQLSGASVLAAAVQQDGKIIVTGKSYGNNQFVVIRYNSNGSLDTSFGANGIASTSVGSWGAVGALALQMDGKIVVAGSSGNINGDYGDFTVVRYNSNGSPDNSFGTNGVITTDIIPGLGDFAIGVVVQPNGNIMVAGFIVNYVTNNYQFAAVVRYHTNGTLDTGFGINGIVTTDLGNSWRFIGGFTSQPDGKIILTGGNVENDEFVNSLLIRYNSDGTLDNSFGIDGILETDVIFGSPASQNNGRILVSGYSGNPADFLVARFNTNGTFDDSFDGDGIVTTNIEVINTSDGIYSIAIQSDGKIVAAGGSRGVTYFSSMTRYKTSGALDNTFGSDGKVVTENDYNIKSVTLQQDGKIIVAGSDYSGTGSDFAILRFNTDGTIDNSFSSDGVQTTDISDQLNDDAYAVAVQPDGKIVVAGTNGNIKYAVARYNANGTLDNTFSGNGKLTTNISPNSGDIAYCITVYPDGKILVGGSSGLVRYNPDGSLDDNFGDNGIVANSDIYIRGFSLLPDGKIVAAGYSSGDFAVKKFNADGSVDESFGVAGLATTDLGIENAQVIGMVIQADGRIVVSGHAGDSEHHDFVLIRYNSDGSLDSSFGIGGIVLTDIENNSDDRAESITIETGGNIVVAGSSGGDFVIVRLLSGLQVGTLDFSQDAHSLLLYPNPVADRATLEYTLVKPEKITIQLVDLQGKIIATYLNQQHQSAGEYQQEIVLPETLVSGMYYIVISGREGKVSIKMMH